MLQTPRKTTENPRSFSVYLCYYYYLIDNTYMSFFCVFTYMNLYTEYTALFWGYHSFSFCGCHALWPSAYCGDVGDSWGFSKKSPIISKKSCLDIIPCPFRSFIFLKALVTT